MTCEACDKPMIDMGIWPQRDGSLAQGWKCPVCGKLIKVPTERRPSNE